MKIRGFHGFIMGVEHMVYYVFMKLMNLMHYRAQFFLTLNAILLPFFVLVIIHCRHDVI